MEQITDGTRMRISGAGPALVLLHGVGLGLEMWEPMATLLERDFRVIRYDLLGHGASLKPPPPYDLGLFVDQLGGVLRNQAADRAIVAGFSMGALIAQGFAIRHPDAVERLVLLNGVFDRSAAERAAVLARVNQVRRGDMARSAETAIERWFTADFRRHSPEPVNGIWKDVLANHVPSFVAAYEVFATADAELAPEVGRIRCPTLVITGSDDRRSTPDMASRLAARLPDGRAALLAGQRHMTPLEVPDQLATHIRAFAAETST